jgi:hypothetical protein
VRHGCRCADEAVRKRALGTRAPLTIPQGPNQRRSLDFLSDSFVDGRRFRILAVINDFTRECLALVADTSLPGCVSCASSRRSSHGVGEASIQTNWNNVRAI